MESTFTFVVEVADSLSEQIITNSNFSGFKADQILNQIIKVKVGQPDSEGKLKVVFSKPIKLPNDCTEWNKSNEGTTRISIELMMSTTTEDVLYDEELSLAMTWYV